MDLIDFTIPRTRLSQPSSRCHRSSERPYSAASLPARQRQRRIRTFSSLNNDRCIRLHILVMKIGYLSAFVLSQLYRWFPSVLAPGDRRPRRKLFAASSRWASPPIFTNAIFGTHTFASNSLDSWGRLSCAWPSSSSPQCFRALSNSPPGRDGSVSQPTKRSCL